MVLMVCDYHITYFPPPDANQILVQTDRMQKLLYQLQTILAAHLRMSLMCMLWTSNHQDFQLPG